ncbi:MAG: DUF3854 domain-containing protein [Actinobacteria bacterium]|nr:DUF3854 domain-containing protein [Actinomycetota bacterium]
MTFYPNRLSENHRRMLFDESGIAQEIVAERGYATVRSRTELPPEFKPYQRRSGLLVPMFSPDEETVGYQLRPNRPRKGGPKYETPGGISPVVDVHPRMLEEVRSGNGPLLITEGAKTGDAATSRGICTVVLAGVWMWCVPKVKPYRLKPCFDHIRLEGREVFVAFDSDYMSKAGVQDALAALVAALQDRGAAVKVVYLPDAADGSKQGVDDYLAAGGTIREMFMLAREFDPADVGRIRLSRDEKLRAAVEDLEGRWWAEEWKGRGGHSERDVALKLIEAAAKSGKIHADGLRVKVSWGVLQVGAKVARRTLAKALARLEERGFLYRDNEGRKVDKTGAFVLRAKVDQYGEKRGQKEKVTQELRECDPGGLPLRAPGTGLPDVPRLRWSQPKYTPKKRGFVKGTRKVRESKPIPARERIERLGKTRGAVVDAVVNAGGELSLLQLCEVLHKKRPRDVRRRVLAMLEDVGVIEVAGDVIRLSSDWREALESERREKGEIEADELAEDRRKRKSRAYRERCIAPVSNPSSAGLAAVEQSREKRAANITAHEEHQAKARAAELEAKRFAKKFVYDRLRALGRIRLGLLQEVLRDAGGTPSYALPAAKSLGCTVERLAEFGGAEFVFPERSAA